MTSQSTFCSSQDDRYTHQERQRRVVVTGLGAITPLGYDIKSTWEGVLRQTNNDILQSQNDTVGITSLYNALQQQNLSETFLVVFAKKSTMHNYYFSIIC